MAVSKPIKPERLDLIPTGPLLETARAFAHGAEKYGDFGYLRDDSEYRPYVAALLRHVMAWSDGEDLDEDSSLNHLALAAANCFMLMALQMRELGVDDRPSVKRRVVIKIERDETERYKRGLPVDEILRKEFES